MEIGIKVIYLHCQTNQTNIIYNSKFTILIKVMEAKIFVIGFPSVSSVMEKISSAIEEAFEQKSKQAECKHNKFTPKWKDEQEKCNSRLPNGVKPEWEVRGEPANEEMRFGYGLNVDEPRCDDYRDWDDFLEAREAFDDFVDAGERCVELGLEKTNEAPIHKCNAIRQPIGQKPPMGVDLIGETQWWCDDCLCDDNWF